MANDTLDNKSLKRDRITAFHLNKPSSCKPCWRRYVIQHSTIWGTLIDLLQFCSYCSVRSSDWPNIAKQNSSN